MDVLPNPSEKTGEKFNLQSYFAARAICKKVAATIASSAEVGMNEDDGQALITDEFRKAGVTKFWHPSKFRIGADTLKNFRDLPDKNIRLSAGDIFFIDVGPIVDEHEADFGETFTLEKSNEAETLQLLIASKEIWLETAALWRTKGLNGIELYEKAAEISKSRGFELNPLMAGHRLGDFPHALFSKESLRSVDFLPAANLWVLEIHVRFSKIQRGSFFEDILFDNSNR